MIWFRLWWFAMRHGLWRDPWLAVWTLSVTARVAVFGLR
jgi:hypothetical protein